MQYVGKDVITQGSLLHLDRRVAWDKLRSRAKQGIRKAQRAGIRVEESRDLSLMAKLWYDPETLTTSLHDDQKLYLAYVDQELVGGIIVTPVTSNTLFYHYGGTNERGREIEANAYLFWHVVEQFTDSDYEFLDVGVSYRNELQHFFQKYCTQPYPIIFHPPQEEVRPQIGMEPFTAANLDVPEDQATAINTRLFEYFGSEFTYMPSWGFALQSALRAVSVSKGATVGVWSSVGEESYIHFLNSLFGKDYRFVSRETSATVYIVCHRWGIYCEHGETLPVERVPLIEDCRDVIGTDELRTHAGSFGEYSIVDFARWFPVPFGALLVGKYFDDRHVWDHFHCLDVTKRNALREALQIHWPRRAEYAQLRRDNWNRLNNLFSLAGMAARIPDNESVPAAYLLKTFDPYGPNAIHERLAKFGVQSEASECDELIAIPCHSNMGNGQLQYVFGAIRGMINPCHTYVRKDPAKA